MPYTNPPCGDVPMRRMTHKTYRQRLFGFVAGCAMAGTAGFAAATEVPLQSTSLGTLHVNVSVAGTGTPFLVDTGSAYVVLAADTFERLHRAGALTRLRSLRAVMANNARTTATVYRVSSLALGAGCEAQDFEAVTLPGARKNILGLSALRQLAPFTVRLDPLRLDLTCKDPGDLAARVDAPAGFALR